MRFRLMLSAAAVLTMAAGADAFACGPSDFENVVTPFDGGANNRDNMKSYTGNLCGYTLTVTSQYSWNEAKQFKSWTFLVNGRTLNVSTSASSLEAAQESDVYKVVVDGRVLYEGVGNNIDIQDGINLLNLIGVADTGSMAQQQVARSETRMVATLVSNRIANVLGGARAVVGKGAGKENKGDTGVSGGDGAMNLGLWATPSNSWIRNDDSFYSFQGTLQNALFGADYKLTDRFIVGFALGGEHTLIHSALNQGRLEAEGGSLTPYMAVSFLDNAVIWNLMGGMALTQNHVEREGAAGRVTGDYLSNRYMLSTNIDGNVALSDNWVLSPRTGLTMAWDHRRNFTESDGTRPLKNDSALLEGKLGMRLTYLVGQWDLFGGADYLHDFFQDQDITAPGQSTDRNEVLASVGVGWHPDDSETFGVEFDNSIGREHMREWTLLANYRKTF